MATYKIIATLMFLGLSFFGIEKIQAQTVPFQTQAAQQQVQTPTKAKAPLNKNLGVIQNEDLTRVFQDMVVVQKRAKDKARKFLFDLHGSFDFSDGPSTFYGLNTNLGYSINNYWEVYVNYIPVFFPTERSIVKKIKDLDLANGQKASLSYAKPKSQVGLELLWVPAYGKDSWGPYHIVRSDTFFKFGAAMINYESEKGKRFMIGVGKTYFISDMINLRLCAGFNSIETIIGYNGVFEKSSTTMAIVDAGLMFYF